MGGSSKPPAAVVQSQSNTATLPDYAKPYVMDVMQRAQAESNRGYTPYPEQRIAEFTPGQQAVQTETLGMQTPGEFGTAGTGLAYNAGLGLGAGQAGLGAAFADPGTMMSPYMQNVVDVQKQQAIRDATKDQLVQNMAATRQGSYGGARNLLAGTERERNLGFNLANIQATGSQNAYQAAQARGLELGQLGMQGLGQAGNALQGIGQLGTARQAADIGRLQAQSAVGAQQQNLTQQQMDTRYADFLRQRDYPMERLGYYANLLHGVPVGLGSTSTTYAPPPSMASQIGGLGLAGIGLSNMMKSG